MGVSTSAMASKSLHIISGLDGQRLQTITVTDDTKIRDVMMRFHQDGKGFVTLLRGVQPLLPDATVCEAGLEDGEELSLLWSKKYYETATLEERDMRSAAMHQYKDLAGDIYVQIPETVDCIEFWAFRHCRSLREVVIPESVTSIGSAAFLGCTSLTQVVIPNSVTSIGANAFDDCSSLTQVVMPDSVTSIGDHAFLRCSSLTQVVIPDSVTSIGPGAFDGCSSLTQVVIPDSVSRIEDFAFCGLTNVTSIG